MKKTWKTLREVIARKKCQSTVQSITVNGEVCTNSKRIAEEFNNYFANVGAELERQIPAASTEPRWYLTGDYPDSIFLTPTNPAEVTTFLLHLKNSSAGHDSLQPSIMKLVSDVIPDPLAHVINLCFEQSVFPEELKKANVLPIHKGGDSNLFQNYQPISMLPVFSKVFERLLHNRCTDFFPSMESLLNHNLAFVNSSLLS